MFQQLEPSQDYTVIPISEGDTNSQSTHYLVNSERYQGLEF